MTSLNPLSPAVHISETESAVLLTIVTSAGGLGIEARVLTVPGVDVTAVPRSLVTVTE